MRKMSILAGVFGVGASSLLNASTISVNFEGAGASLASADVAGLPGYAAQNWNSRAGSAVGGMTVVNSLGNTVAGVGGDVQFVYSASSGTGNVAATSADTGTTNGAMFSGILKQQSANMFGAACSVTLTFTRLAADKTYDLLAYVASDLPASSRVISAVADAKVDSAVHYYNSVDITGMPVFGRITSTNSSSPTTNGNYLLFEGLEPNADGTISLRLNNARLEESGEATIGVAGLQLISVPEPTSFGVLSAFTMLLVCGRRQTESEAK